MKLDKFALIILLVCIIGGAAFYFSDQKSEKFADQESGRIFASGLTAKVNDIKKITVKNKSSTSNFVLQGDAWVMSEKDNYPVQFGKIKQLILNIADLQTLESKTSNPTSYGKLGVQAVGEAGSIDSKQVILFDKADNVVLSLIVGKTKSSSQAGLSSLYARKDSEKKSWLLKGQVTLPANDTDWLEKSIINIAQDRIQKVSISNKENKLAFNKNEKKDEKFTLSNLPSNLELKSDNELKTIAGALQNLSFNNVKASSSFEKDGKEIAQAEFITFNGLSLFVSTTEVENKHYIWIETKADESNTEAANESKELNAKLSSWVYEVASFKAKNFTKTLLDITKEIKKDEAKEEVKIDQSKADVVAPVMEHKIE